MSLRHVPQQLFLAGGFAGTLARSLALLTLLASSVSHWSRLSQAPIEDSERSPFVRRLHEVPPAVQHRHVVESREAPEQYLEEQSFYRDTVFFDAAHVYSPLQPRAPSLA